MVSLRVYCKRRRSCLAGMLRFLDFAGSNAINGGLLFPPRMNAEFYPEPSFSQDDGFLAHGADLVSMGGGSGTSNEISSLNATIWMRTGIQQWRSDHNLPPNPILDEEVAMLLERRDQLNAA